MPRQSKAARHADILVEALTEFDQIQMVMREERMQCLRDRRFYSIAGAQWEGALGEQFENKPKFEFNKIHLSVIRIFNEYRNNRISVNFTSRDGTSDDKMADACDGMYRADEKACVAEEAYDNGFEEGVGGGFGAWRVRADYENDTDEDDDRQRCRMEPIHDADSCVFFNLGAMRQDKSDATRCYVLTPYTHADYEDEFDDSPTTWPKSVYQWEFDWTTPDIVWVCEHYRIEEDTQLVHFFRGLDEEQPDLRVTDDELAADPDMLEELQATGFREVRQKKVKRKRVHKYLLSGGKILEDCGIIPGDCIPIIPFFAKRWVVDGVERCMGHVRLAADAQRLMNMLMSWLAEMAARFDIEKPILTPEQIAGHTTLWAKDNVEKFPYLLLNAVTDADGNVAPPGPLNYTRAPNIPPAMAALAQIAQQALEDLLGNQQAGEQIQPNLSGKAVELIQNRLDMQVFIYMSNLSKAMKRCGEVWLGIMRDIAVEEGRRMKTVDAGGEASSVVLNQPGVDEKTGQQVVHNDMSKASFEVDSDVGPSSTSRKAATVRALTGLLQMVQDPETQQALVLGAIASIEGEGLDDLRSWARQRAIRIGSIKPTDDEKQELAQEQANQQPDPQAQFLLASADQAKADAAQSRAKTVQTIADADLKRAQTAQTYAATMGAHNEQQIASATALRDLLTPQPQPAAVQQF
jgi:hypothetical protein